MVSAIAKQQKRLGDFLNEQQEPFILEVYLLEREYSKGWRLNEDSSNKSLEQSVSCGLNIKRKIKALMPICKVLTTLLNKLARHSQSNTLSRDYEQRNKHASVLAMFKSCSNVVDEEGTSLSLHKDQQLFSSNIHQTSNVCDMNMRWQRQRYTESSPESLRKIPPRRVPNVNEDIGDMQHRIQGCGVHKPKRITEDSLSVAIWNLIGPPIKKDDCNKELQEFLPRPDASQILKSRRVSHKTKKQLFDCVRDVTMTLSTKDDRKRVCRQFKGPLEVRNLICQRTKEWGQYVGDGVNLTDLLTMDSTMEWCKFQPYIKDIGVEITDAILEDIVSEMIETLVPNT